MARSDLTCWSCIHWQRDGCAKGETGWPLVLLGQCDHAEYEPGSDESERENAE